LKKDEDHDWDLYEALAEKTIHGSLALKRLTLQLSKLVCIPLSPL